ALLCLHFSDLYNLQRLPSPGEIYVRLLFVLGTLSLLLAALGYLSPSIMIGRGVIPGGLIILTFGLLAWRSAYSALLRGPYLRERVYILGAGDRASRLVKALRAREHLGMDVVGWAGAVENGSLTREALGATLLALMEKQAVDRVILAMRDRRGTMP